ncbi:caspase domain protein [Coleofasciculus chthonoplastes PCC 7420]|uniref:Caspase domain protein n=1 Tax=Coleofasciculus chthonoplastes PCC 7420 TaxID=118168 RepID=B4VVF0_9CYAN|nr:caspase family protein [Coleofasciculus chthonoplastes]EDX74163.1 caspase domain protein [Coleofasciculus chthonoplastes PCC 7420]
MKRQALVVGINRYPFLKNSQTGQYANLSAPANDAETIAQFLEKYGTDEKRWSVRRLPEVIQDKKFRVATTETVGQEKLSTAIRELFNPEPHHIPDVALFFFAGHGLRKQQNGKTEGFLATSDTNQRTKWGIRLNWLRQVLQESPVQQQIVWLDCCHSGELLNFLTEAELKDWLSGGDRCLIAACRDDRNAYATGKHGVLTEVLLQGLNPQQQPSGEWVTSGTLTNFLQKQVETHRVLQRQIPLSRHFGEQIRFWQGKNVPQISRKDYQNRCNLLKQVKQEVEGIIAQSLPNITPITLHKHKQPNQVQRSWDTEVKTGNYAPTPLPSGTKIIEVFEQSDIGGKLLILGQPGAGKTITLLELARELLTRAETDVDEPIPVFLNLSSWKYNNQKIADWLVDEISDRYKFLSTKTVKLWLKASKLLPLLDSLDELESKRQEKCIQAINEFLASEYQLLPLVVCSRCKEYQLHSTQLNLHGAIVLEPLNKLQVQGYLASIKQTELWDTINSNPDLVDLIRVPLMLRIMTIAWESIAIEEWQNCNSPDRYREYLFNAYIKQMLARKLKYTRYAQAKEPEPKTIKLWLIYLAKRLEAEYRTEFLIERMQPGWLPNTVYKQIYALGVGGIFGLIGGLIVGLSVFLSMQIFTELFIGLIVAGGVGVYFGFFFGIWAWLTLGQASEINPVETLNTSWLHLGKSLVVGLIIGLITWGVTALLFPHFFGRPLGWIVPVIIGPILVVVFEMTGPDIQIQMTPNQGIWHSLKNAIRFAIVGGTVMGLLAFLLSKQLYFIITSSLFVKLSSSDLSATTVVHLILSGIVLGLFWGLTQAGTACIQHFTLRVILVCNGSIPWNYTRFLNYATKRMFLQRIGGRYKFSHKFLQEHFAKMEP